MSSTLRDAALTTTSLLSFFNLACVSRSNLENSSLATAAIETSRVAAYEVNANFSIGLGGTPSFRKPCCMALTDTGAGRGQDILVGDAEATEKAPRISMAGVSASLR